MTLAVPAGAVDSHMHVFGDFGAYPLAEGRPYTPRLASMAQYREMAEALGLERFVMVQPTSYGVDNRLLHDTLVAGGGQGRGVAVIDDSLSAHDLDKLHAVGVRGARVNAQSLGHSDSEAIGAILKHTARAAERLGWHVQLFASLPTIATMADILARLPSPVVIDHMGLAMADSGVGQAGFGALIDLVRGGAWVKLSGADRVAGFGGDPVTAGPIARALIAANPDRVVWGTDWPHTGGHAGVAVAGEAPLIDYRPVDDKAMLGLLADWVDHDPGLYRRILVDNPMRLYDFKQA